MRWLIIVVVVLIVGALVWRRIDPGAWGRGLTGNAATVGGVVYELPTSRAGGEMKDLSSQPTIGLTARTLK